MEDQEDFTSIATEITLWESAALQLPLAQVGAVLADLQHDLALSLNAFNGVYLDHADQAVSADTLADAIMSVARRATATAIFGLGLAQRTRLAAHHN